MRRIAAALALTALLASLSASSAAAFPVSPTVWYVDDDGLAGANGCNGNNAVPSVIQVAVNAASPGDTIRVCPGRYVGTVEVDKTLRLTATAPWAATIAAPTGGAEALVYLHDASGIFLRWFNIVAGTTTPCAQTGDLVYANNAPDTRIRANHMGLDGAEGTDCRPFYTGVQLLNSPDSFVGWNRVTDFSSTGITESGGSDGTMIRGNTIRFLHAALSFPAYTDSVGILLFGSDDTARGNNVHSGPAAGVSTPLLQVGINDFGSNDVVYRNAVRRSNYGIQSINTTGIQFTDNRVRDVVVDGMILAGADNAEVSGNHVRAGAEGIHVNNLTDGANIHDNDFAGASDPDCNDLSSGGGTSGTANTWTNDIGDTSSPSGICAPAP